MIYLTDGYVITVQESCFGTHVKKKFLLALDNALLMEMSNTQKITSTEKASSLVGFGKRRRKRFFDFDSLVAEDVVNDEEVTAQSKMILHNCSWLISGPENKTLNLTIIDFAYNKSTTTKKRRKRFSFDDLVVEDVSFDDLEFEDVPYGGEETSQSQTLEPCDENFIEVYDGPNADFPKIGNKICGNIDQSFKESSASSMFVVLSFPATSVIDILRIRYNVGGKYYLFPIHPT